MRHDELLSPGMPPGLFLRMPAAAATASEPDRKIDADDRGIELEIVALDLEDAAVVIHVTRLLSGWCARRWRWI